MSNDNRQKMIADALRGNNASTIYSGVSKVELTAEEELVTKMVRGIETDRAIRDNAPTTSAQSDIFIRGVLAASIERIRDSRNTLQLLPDIKQVIEIMIGSILSPKDMGEPTLTYTSTFEELGDTSTSMLKYVKKYFSSSYKLEERLDEILWDILGYTGSYPIAILPETSLDYMINSNSTITLESLTSGPFNSEGKLENLGWLGDKTADGGVSLENSDVLSFFKSVTGTNTASFENKLFDDIPEITLVDNFDILKMPGLRRKISNQSTHTTIAQRRESVNTDEVRRLRADSVSSLEAIRITNNDDYTRSQKDVDELNKLYPTRQFRATPVLRVKTSDLLERKSLGHPKTLKIPTEAVIPVVNPMDTRDHIGYFILIDQAGFAIRITDMESLYKMIQSNSNNIIGSNMASYMIQQAANAGGTGLNSEGDLNRMQALAEAVPVFQEQVERSLLDRIANGRVGTGYKLADMEAPALLMLSRALMGKQTQMLYVPAEIMSYMATDYDQYGLGKTLLDDSKLLAALRSLNQMVNSIASTKNAITKRGVNIRIPPAEKDPAKAVRIMMQEFVKGTHGEYPLSNSPADQINYIQRSGISVKVEDHPGYPNSEFTVDSVDNVYKPISTEYDEFLKNQHIRSFGFSPELINGANGTDFATQTIFANVLTARVLRKLSNRFTPNLGDFIRKFTYNSTTLFDGLVSIVEKSSISIRKANNTPLSNEEIVTLFIESINVTLPPADKAQMVEQKEALEAAKEFYDAGVDQIFSSDWLSEDILGRIGGSENIDSHKAYIKGYFIREWMKENGVGLELFEVLDVDKYGKPLIDFESQHADYIDNISRSILPFFKRKLMRSGNINAHLEKFEGSLPNKPETDSFGGGETDSFSDTTEGNDDFGMDDELSPPTDEVNPDQDPDSSTESESEEGDDNPPEDDTTDANGKDNIV